MRPDGTGDAPTIQAAVNLSATGDVVLLGPGAYTWASQQARGESMLEVSKAITLRGEAGSDATILDAQRHGRILRITRCDSVMLEGLTIQNGQDPGDFVNGAGVAADSTPVYIRSCVIRGNLPAPNGDRGGRGGCGIAATFVAISNSRVADNRSGGIGGAGIQCGIIVATNCLFSQNIVLGVNAMDGGGVCAENANLTNCNFERNIIVGSFAAGGGARIGAGVVNGCTFRGNRVRADADLSAFGGGLHIDRVGFVTRCAFIDNTADCNVAARGGAISGFGSAITVTNCTLYGNHAATIEPDSILTVGGIDLSGGSVDHTIFYGTTGPAVSPSTSTAFCCFFATSIGASLHGIDRGGSFTADPLFCKNDASATLDLRLQSDSPCAPGRNPTNPRAGLLGSGTVGCGPVPGGGRSGNGAGRPR